MYCSLVVLPVWGAVNPLPGISGKGSTAPRHGGVVKVSKGHGESLESYFVEERFSVWNFHRGTFAAEPSLRNSHCGTLTAEASLRSSSVVISHLGFHRLGLGWGWKGG